MNNKTEQQQKDLEGVWNSQQARHSGLVSYPVWQYLQGQNVEALLDYREKFELFPKTCGVRPIQVSLYYQ